jgi:hypothetical protein
MKNYLELSSFGVTRKEGASGTEPTEVQKAIQELKARLWASIRCEPRQPDLIDTFWQPRPPFIVKEAPLLAT